MLALTVINGQYDRGCTRPFAVEVTDRGGELLELPILRRRVAQVGLFLDHQPVWPGHFVTRLRCRGATPPPLVRLQSATP